MPTDHAALELDASVNALQERAQLRGARMPEYEIRPASTQEATFEARVMVFENHLPGTYRGLAASEALAKHLAATEALKNLRELD